MHPELTTLVPMAVHVSSECSFLALSHPNFKTSFNFLACACDLRGSHDNLCDVVTGQCKCNGLGIGRQCNECPVGEWGFPRCRPCECHGHATTCDAVSGVCIDCAHNTAGDHCELCKAGYFGDATKGELNIPYHHSYPFMTAMFISSSPVVHYY